MNRVHGRVEVAVSTLDEAVARIRKVESFERPYLKLDTQRFDLAVIEGGPNTLRTFAALQAEASVTPIYEGAPDFAHLIRHLEAKGFELSGIFPINPSHFPRMFEFDCHTINRALIAL